MRLEYYTYAQFHNLIKKNPVITDTLTDVFSNVCNFYINLSKDKYSQEVAYEINDVADDTGTVISGESEEAKLTYAQFGIYFKSLVQLNDNSLEMLSTDRKYIIFIGNSDKNPNPSSELLKSEVKSAVNTYLPNEVTPSWYVDFREYENYKQVSRTRDIIREVYPEINSMINYFNLKKSFIRDETLEDEIKVSLESYPGLVRKDITKEVDAIANVYYTNNLNTANIFIDKLDTLAKDLTDNDYIVYTGLEQDIYIYCAIYLTYFHNANCFIPESKQDMYLTILMEQFYDNNAMLIEDKVDYLLNFPTYSFSASDYTLGYLGTLQTSLKGSVQLCSLNCPVSAGVSTDAISKENVVVLNNYNFRTANILSIFDFFKINSKDVEEARMEESKLLKVLTKFESVLQISKDKLINIFDIFFVELSGELQIGYVNELSFNSVSSLTVTCLKSPTTNAGAWNPSYHLSFDNMYRFYPLDIIKDKETAIKDIIKSDYRFDTPERQIKRGASKVSKFKINSPLKFASKYAIPLRYLYKNISNVPMVLENQNELYYELGVYAPTCYTLRTNVIDIMLATLKRETLRQEPQAISAFGGFHPLRDVQLYIDEDNMKIRG